MKFYCEHYEEYDGQGADGYDYMGVRGRMPEPIWDDPAAQAKEFVRCYGHRIIFMYRSAGCRLPVPEHFRLGNFEFDFQD